MVFVREIGIGVFVEPNHLYDTDQHYRLLDALFQGGLWYVFGVPIVRARANMELPCQLRLTVYQRAYPCKNQAVEDKNRLKRTRIA